MSPNPRHSPRPTPMTPVGRGRLQRLTGRQRHPINISGVSFSTDGGITFTRLTKANGQSPFENTFGDPVVLYDKPTRFWVTVWLDGASGLHGLGGYRTPIPRTRIAGPISAFTERRDDRESGWATTTRALPSSGNVYFLERL